MSPAFGTRFPVFIALALFTASARSAPPAQVRFATFNASLNRNTAGQLFADLSNPSAGTATVAQAKRIAEIIQRNAPDILLVNEFDYDTAKDGQGRTVVDLFHDNYLATPQQPGLPVLSFPWRYTGPVNTGVSSNQDLDNSGTIVTTPGSEAYGNDCFGFGEFPGKYGMAVYSRYPIATAAVRTFQLFLWKDMPGALLPDNSTTLQPKDWYSTAELNIFRLSSKSHWDIPIDLGGGHMVHFLVDHPTPPVFDSTEDRNGKRNHDEIRFWADYIDPARASYHKDDAGVRGGLAAGSRFLIAGDHNADPVRGDSAAGAALQFTTHPLINNAYVPSAAAYGNNTTNTADFTPDLRVDYVLPSLAGFRVISGGVYWPLAPHPQATLVTTDNASDHKLVWLDVQPLPIADEAVKNLTAARNSQGILLSFKAAPGYIYAVEEAASLSAGPWTEAAGSPVFVDAAYNATATVPVSIPGRRSFRIVVRFAP